MVKKKFKVIALILIAALAAAGGAYVALQPLEVEALLMETQTVSLTFTETGSYAYTRSYAVYPIISGEIVDLAVAEGDQVQAGDVLAVVSATDYQHQINQINSTIAGYNGQIANLRLQEQQARDSLALTLHSLEGQLITLEAEIAKSEEDAASLETQIRIQERIVELNREAIQHARGYLSDMRDVGEDYEITQARQMVNAAQTTYATSQQVLEQMRTGDVPEAVWEGQRLALETQIAAITTQMGNSYTSGMQQFYNAQIGAAQHSIAQLEEMSGRATLLAPVDGVITSLPAADQNVLLPQSPAAILEERPMVEVYVPVREIDGVRPGDAVELLIDRRLGVETLAGTVVDVAEEAQVMLSALGVEERKVLVRIRPAADILGIGYDVDVRFSPYTFADVLVVPKTALFETADGDFVWVIDEQGELARRAVARGSETRDGYIVDEGLRPGDTVVVDANDTDLRQSRRAVAAATL